VQEHEHPVSVSTWHDADLVQIAVREPAAECEVDKAAPRVEWYLAVPQPATATTTTAKVKTCLKRRTG
jgi:hypothetical protein